MKMKKLSLRNRWRLLLSGVAATSAAVAGLNVAWRFLLRRALPQQNGRLRMKGLRQPVEIIRDQWGVPHIYAQTEHDLFFAQGFVHAQDRLFQMDTLRRVGAGRTSEIAGPSGLAMDRFARYFGWPRAAEAQAKGISPGVAAVMGAYCAGVNHFIEQEKLPVEFKLLSYRPDPWRFLDTATWSTVLAWGLSVNWESELIRARLLHEIGAEKTAELTQVTLADYQTIIPDETVGQRLAAAMLDAYQQALAGMPLGNIPAGRGVGSNNWVVAGEHTDSGRPILANDPHLPPIFPALWYENHLCAAGFNVSGFTMPGVPGVIIGHNEHLAWGLTNAFPDVQDIYIERFHPRKPHLYEYDGEWVEAEIVHEEIKVRGRKSVEEVVRYTRHGPVISDFLAEESGDLSLKWSHCHDSDHLRTILDINRAANWQQFRDALRHWGFPSQNVVYADVDGHIGYIMPGLIPIRKQGSGIVPAPGWKSAYEWQGWIPFEELPVTFDPPAGIIASANNRVQGDSYPHFLTSVWLPDYRAKRIVEMLQRLKPLSLSDNIRIQMDIKSLQAQKFLGLAIPLMEEQGAPDHQCRRAFNLLRSWDYKMRAEAIAPSIYFGWHTFFTTAVYEQALGSELASRLLKQREEEGFPLDPYLEVAPELAMDWLAGGSPPWAGNIERLLWPSLQKTLGELRRHLGSDEKKWLWGRLHFIQWQHPLTQIPVLGRSWKPRQWPAAGDGYTVNQTDSKMQFPPDPVSVIASCRMIIDVGAWDNSLAALPGGQSGHPAGRHYLDGLDDWQNGRYHSMLFSREKIEAAAEGRLILTPLSEKGPESG